MPSYRPRPRSASFSAADRLLLAEGAGWICADCHRPVHNGDKRSPLYMQAGHIADHAGGGLPILSNGKCVCRKCNQSAGGKEMVARQRSKAVKQEREIETLKSEIQ